MGRLFLWLFFCLAFLTIGCLYRKEELQYPGGPNCQNSANKFASDVFPIITTNCATGSDCHGKGSIATAGPLTNYNEIRNVAVSIKTQIQSGLMPKTGSLKSSEIQSIICWVDSGAPNN